jgi:biotin-dependent carboxylase-like uncharacterized protein
MKIITTGLNARFTDLGRVGHQHAGFTQSGALDTGSHILANVILGMPKNNPTIEVLLGGFSAKAREDLHIAVTGAETSVFINGVLQSLNRSLLLKKDQTLEIKEPKLGARNYIACKKHFKATSFLSSVCAVQREKTGGLHLDGKSLQIGDEISFDESSSVSSKKIMKEHLNSPVLAPSLIATPITNQYKIRIVLGYQESLFDHQMKARFFNQQYTVSNETSSMGMRLSGNSIGHMSIQLYSEGIANGAVQITPNGLPIIMLAERQTIGGYPKIGSVITNDLAKLGQSRPGTIIQFEECDLFTARQLWLLTQTRIDNFVEKQFSKEKHSE